MKALTKILSLVVIGYLFCNVHSTNAAGLNKGGKSKILYETDGHYWTVLVVATLLKVPEAKAIAFAAEYPDNVINDYGYIVRTRYTYLYPKSQKRVHALTGGVPEFEREVSMYMLRAANTAREKGIACHRLGDSFSHANDKTGKMYPHLVAHLFQWKKPDKIRNNSNEYLDYVSQLVKGLGGKGAEVNLAVFEYIAKSGLTSTENAAILKAEYKLLTGSLAFNIKKSELPIVEKYLQERMRGTSYAVHIDSDEKGRETTTIILVRNTAIALN